MRARQVSVFLLRRILALVVLLVLISFLVFGLLYLAPGNAIQVLLGTHPASPASIAALTAKYHLNDSFIVQYLLWLKGVVHLNLGVSIQTGQTVTSLIGSRIGLTIFLGVYAFLLSVVLRRSGRGRGGDAHPQRRRPGHRRRQPARRQRAGLRQRRSSCCTCWPSTSAGFPSTGRVPGSRTGCGT